MHAILCKFDTNSGCEETVRLKAGKRTNLTELLGKLGKSRDSITYDVKMFPDVKCRGVHVYVKGNFHLTMPKTLADHLFGTSRNREKPFLDNPSIYINNNVPNDRPGSGMGVGTHDDSASAEPNDTESTGGESPPLNSRYKKKENLLRKCLIKNTSFPLQRGKSGKFRSVKINVST